MNPPIRVARPRPRSGPALGLAGLALALSGCASGPTADHRAARADALPAAARADTGALPVGGTTDRGRRTLLPSPIGQLAPEDVPAAPGGR